MNAIRKRLVNFRVTDQEFERIKAASDRLGARCVSEFARAVMLGGAAPDAPSESAGSVDVAGKLLSFERRLAMIELCVTRLSDGLPDPKSGPSNSEN